MAVLPLWQGSGVFCPTVQPAPVWIGGSGREIAVAPERSHMPLLPSGPDGVSGFSSRGSRAFNAPTKSNAVRRGRDSNPRDGLAPTRFPVVPDRPLQHLSVLGAHTHTARLRMVQAALRSSLPTGRGRASRRRTSTRSCLTPRRHVHRRSGHTDCDNSQRPPGPSFHRPRS